MPFDKSARPYDGVGNRQPATATLPGTAEHNLSKPTFASLIYGLARVTMTGSA
jgi:hypothetical protein